MNGPLLTQAPRQVGGGYKVAFRFAEGRLEAIWEPYPAQVKGQMLLRYRHARDIFLARLAEELGGNIMCVEAE